MISIGSSTALMNMQTGHRLFPWLEQQQRLFPWLGQQSPIVSANTLWRCAKRILCHIIWALVILSTLNCKQEIHPPQEEMRRYYVISQTKTLNKVDSFEPSDETEFLHTHHGSTCKHTMRKPRNLYTSHP